MKKHFITILKIAISIAILAVLFFKASQNDGWEKFLTTEKKWGWIVLGFCFITGANTLSFWRWHGLLRALDLRLPRLEVLRIGFISFTFGAFSVGMVGIDATRTYYVARHNASNATQVLLSVFVDRVCGFLGLLLLASGAAFSMRLSGGSHFLAVAENEQLVQGVLWTLFASTIIGIAGFSTLFLIPYLSRHRWVIRLTEFRYGGNILKRVLDAGLAYQRRPSVMLVALLQSIVVHVLLALCVFSVAKGLAGTFPTFQDHLIISPIAHFVQVIPLPGGIGVFEGALATLFQVISGEEAFSDGMFVGLVYRLLTFGIAAIGLGLYLKGRKRE